MEDKKNKNSISKFWAFYRRMKFLMERYYVKLGYNLLINDYEDKDIVSIVDIYYGEYTQKFDAVHKKNQIVKMTGDKKLQTIIDNFDENKLKPLKKLNQYQFIDVHYMKDSKCNPTIFYIHGGSWASCDKVAYTRYCKDLVKSGFTVVNINYRLIPNVDFFTCIYDTECAIRCAIDNAKTLHIDKDNIFLIGDSAGAHLITMFAGKYVNNYLFNFPEITIRALGLYYGVFDFHNIENDTSPILKNFHHYFLDNNPQNYDKFVDSISCINLINNKFPACLVTSGGIDKLHSQSVKIIKKLKRAKVEYVELFFDKSRLDGTHAFLNFESLNSSKEAKKELIKLFKSKINN